MPIEVAPGVLLWTRQELGLPDRRTAQVSRKTEWWGHYSTGQELGRDDLAAWWREIFRFHTQTRGWDDIGYNLGVGRDADPERAHILMGRGWNAIGAHCPDHNAPGIGVVFLGNDDPDALDLTPGVKRAWRWTWDEGNRRNGLSLPRYGHRDGRSTACPGNEAYAWIKEGMPTLGAVAPPNPGPAPAPPAPTPEPEKTRGTGWFKANHPTIGEGAGYGNRNGNDTVRHAQHLAGMGGAADGKYGPVTKGKIREKQRAAGLSDDGVCGPDTWSILHPVVKEPANGDRVVEVQHELGGIKVDADYGPITRERAKAYQRGHGIGVDGIFGRQSYRAGFN